MLDDREQCKYYFLVGRYPALTIMLDDMSAIAILESMKTEDENRISNAAAALGRKGGPARAKALTKDQRKAIAKKAAAARWGKK
jgi:hypothetical protein